MKISKRKYAVLIRVLRNLPARLHDECRYTLRERNAVREAQLLKRRLADMAADEELKVYVSGAITGLPSQQVEEKFRRAERRLRRGGMRPVCPIDNGLEASAEWRCHMRRDLEMLAACDAIYMLDDWRQSRGAQIELRMAMTWRKMIIFEKTDKR